MQQNDLFSRLSQKQLAAAECLLSCKSHAETAETVGVNIETVRRWLREDKDFGEYLSQCRRGLLLGTISALAGTTLEAVAALLDLMRSSQDERVRVACAKQLLASFPALDDHIKLSEDLAEIKAAIASMDGANG